jgi:hypothetical protein
MINLYFIKYLVLIIASLASLILLDIDKNVQ